MAAGVLFALTLLLAAKPAPAAEPADLAFFESKVRPVLAENCYKCHGPKKQENRLRVDSLEGLLRGGMHGPAILPGKPDQSWLILAINHGERVKMPEKRKLPPGPIADLTEWVRRGTPWPGEDLKQIQIKIDQEKEKEGQLFTDRQKSFWAFQPVRKPAVPAAGDGGWAATPVDRFIMAKLRERGLKPTERAGKLALIRRATFDLTGLPPTEREMADFEADASPDAYEKLIDRLLASPRYGERWGRHWLDLARYADSNGMDENVAYAYAFEYRDYVIRAMNDDKPYDRFVQEQLAGDLLEAAATDRQEMDRFIATGFLSIGPKMLAEDDGRKMQWDIIDEQIDTMGRSMMGLTLGCARCHDHKFDPIPAADYYSLAGIFKSTKTMEHFNVVAIWNHHELQNASQKERMESISRQLALVDGKLDEIRGKALAGWRAAERAKLADYLLAAGRPGVDLAPGPSMLAGKDAKTPPGLIMMEAESFTEGNLLAMTDGYGTGIGVVINRGTLPNFAEYEFEAATDGCYQIDVRYAAEAARPVMVYVDGTKYRDTAAGATTGSWHPEGQKWEAMALVKLSAGKHRLRVERTDGPIPHFDKFAVYPRTISDESKLSQPMSAGKAGGPPLNDEVVGRWRALLASRAGNEQSIFAALAPKGARPVSLKGAAAKALEGVNLEDPSAVARRIAELALDEEGNAKNAGLEAVAKNLRTVIANEKTGPFAPPKDVEKQFDEPTRTRIEALGKERKALEDARPKPLRVMGVKDYPKAEDVNVQLRGNYLTTAEVVHRGFPRIVSGPRTMEIKAGSGRLELARWMTDPSHPLTARVMVNRLWRWHFGAGLVSTVDNFGRLGEAPSHPELLDWLAASFIESGQSIKAMHRLIMLSSVYQMGSGHDETGWQTDPDNRLLWRFNRRRLEAESVRDSILATAEMLDLKMGGQLMKVEDHKYVGMNPGSEVYQTPRRSVYLPVIRSVINEVMLTFDMADPSVINGDRASTTVAPQALFMMNAPVVGKAAERWAGDLLADAAATDEQRLERAYRRAFGRAPTKMEAERGLKLIGKYEEQLLAADAKMAADRRRLLAWRALCRVLIGSNEFIYVD